MESHSTETQANFTQTIPVKGFSPTAKGCFSLFSIFLFIGLAFVSLETWSRLSETWSHNHNPFLMGQTPISMKLPAGVPIVLEGNRWDLHSTAVPPFEPPAPLVDFADEAWPQSFAALSPMQRHLAAGRKDRMVLEFDKNGSLEETWGCPLEKTFFARAGRGLSGELWKCGLGKSGFSAALLAALNGSDTTKDLTVPLLGIHFQASFRPISSLGGALVCVPNPPSIIGQLYSLPTDSPWEVPYFRYKKDIPNLRWGVPGTCYLNNAGFRGKHVEIPKPPGRYRILCVGGSTTEEGSLDDNTYPALLEKKLAAAFPNNAIEVVNCGISGTDTAAHLMQFADYLALQPDLLIMYEGVNDATSSLPMHWLLCDSPLWVKTASCSHFFRRKCNAWLYGNDEKLRSDVETFTLGRFRIMRQWALANHAEALFCSIASPAYDELPATEQEYLAYRARGIAWIEPPAYLKIIHAINAGLKELSEKEGWGYIPVAENFHFGLDCFGDMCHMFPEGTERKAEVVFQCLKERLPALLNAKN